MTNGDITDRLTQEVERLLAENARLAAEKRADVGTWLKAEADYQGTIRLFREENAKLNTRVKALEEGLKKLSFMAQTSGGTAGRDEELCAAIDKACALLTPAPAEGGE